MKTKSSSKSAGARTTAKARSAPKEVQLDPSVPTMETRLLKPSGMIPSVLVAALRDRITALVRADLEAQSTTQSSNVDVQMPVNVFTGEAIAIAARIEWHQVPRDGVTVSLAPHAARLGGDVAPQIVYLADQVRIADSLIAQSRVTNPYDWVLATGALDSCQVPVTVGATPFPSGLVFDSRVFTPLADVPPVQLSDSDSPLQHMAVVREFVLPL